MLVSGEKTPSLSTKLAPQMRQGREAPRSASCTLPLLPCLCHFHTASFTHHLGPFSSLWTRRHVPATLHCTSSSPSEAFQCHACQVFLHSLCMYIPPTPSNLPALLLRNKAPTVSTFQSQLYPLTSWPWALERLWSMSIKRAEPQSHAGCIPLGAEFLFTLWWSSITGW